MRYELSDFEWAAQAVPAEQIGIAPHIPVWDMSLPDDGTFSRANFVFNSKQRFN